jgi:hypothetical protein
VVESFGMRDRELIGLLVFTFGRTMRLWESGSGHRARQDPSVLTLCGPAVANSKRGSVSPVVPEGRGVDRDPFSWAQSGQSKRPPTSKVPAGSPTFLYLKPLFQPSEVLQSSAGRGDPAHRPNSKSCNGTVVQFSGWVWVA